MNICGVLVHADPKRRQAAIEAMTALPGVEVHAEAPNGRIVVTVEDQGETHADETVLKIHRLPGVLSAALVYHHFDSEAAPTDPVAPAA